MSSVCVLVCVCLFNIYSLFQRRVQTLDQTSKAHCNNNFRLCHVLKPAVCSPECSNGGNCVSPSICQCVEPFVGLACEDDSRGQCMLYIQRLERAA